MHQGKYNEEKNQAVKENATLQIRVTSLDEQLQKMKHKYEAVKQTLNDQSEMIERKNKELSDYEAKYNLLRRRMETFDTERKDKKQIATLEDALNRSREDLDKQTLLYIEVENQRDTLEGELEFLTSVHELEMKEWTTLAYRDTTAENREFWKYEMDQALREIQQVYDDKMESMKNERETFYQCKEQEIQTAAARQNLVTVHAKEENNRLRTQLSEIMEKCTELKTAHSSLQRELDSRRRDEEEQNLKLVSENRDLMDKVAKMHADMERILKELRNIMDTKHSLEMEIDAYRKLLEGEEIRIDPKKDVKPQISDGHVKPDDPKMPGMPSVSGQITATMTYQRSAKGPVEIAECSADGKLIVIENTERKDEKLGGWRLTRNVDGVDKANYTLKPDFVLRASAKVKIWALGSRPAAAPSDVESNQPSWGAGANITTKLINQSGDERATHIQKTVLVTNG